MLVLPVARLDRVTGAAPPARSTPPSREPSSGSISLRGRRLLPIALGGACGAAAANSLGAFFIASVVAVGQPVTTAGLLLSAGSVAGIGSRLLTGWIADNVRTDQLRVVAGMLLVGLIGYLLLGRSTMTPLLVAGTILAFAAGWGWPGLLHLAVVRENRDAAAAASGVTQAGMYLGGVAGPVIFGATAQWAGYPTAWSVSAALALLGAMALLSRGGGPAEG